MCGRHIANENANFCEYCGESLRNVREPEFQYQEPQNMFQNIFQDNKVVEESEKPVSFKNWLGSMCLIFIPLIGFFVYLFMLLKWSFDQKTPKSKKNWARAHLIIVFIFLLMLTSVINSTEFQQVYNTLYQ
jgi:quinol-cytochrome oxidoreductase complex cytochrome b subunit